MHVVPKDRALLLPTGFTLKEVEKRAIQDALQRNQWKKVKTARELGIDKNTLRRKIRRLRIIEPALEADGVGPGGHKSMKGCGMQPSCSMPHPDRVAHLCNG
ncbi:MAG TPA: hypothetical protein EYP19_13055 [Desulfobacterales bacterium]|nr:hypothetical protein [Desulfobacterales bacterium]